MTTTGQDGPRPLRIAALRSAADGVLALELVAPDGGPLPAWTPGAHVDLSLPCGRIRSYSLCSDPGDLTRYRIAVLRVAKGRGGSVQVHDTLRVGDVLPVSAPRNRFELVDADEYLLIAGGIGITPLLPMAHRLSAAGRTWRLLYAGRSRTTMAFLDELARDGRVTVVAEDEAGRPDLAAELARSPGATVYACGPAGLLDAVRGLSEGPVHTERFAPVTEGTPPDERGVLVELARSGLSLTVPAGLSILDAVRDAGVSAPSSCEMGICGTCETKVLDGVPDHRDDLLTDDERAAGNTMMICVSRGRGERLVLDL